MNKLRFVFERVKTPSESKEQLITISLNDLHTHRLLPITEESNHTITSASAMKAINTEAKSITLRKAIKNHNKRRTNFTRDPQYGVTITSPHEGLSAPATRALSATLRQAHLLTTVAGNFHFRFRQ